MDEVKDGLELRERLAAELEEFIRKHIARKELSEKELGRLLSLAPSGVERFMKYDGWSFDVALTTADLLGIRVSWKLEE